MQATLKGQGGATTSFGTLLGTTVRRWLPTLLPAPGGSGAGDVQNEKVRGIIRIILLQSQVENEPPIYPLSSRRVAEGKRVPPSLLFLLKSTPS